ncbi:putative RNA recognition motif domain, nucleotide-binding alpha-beta plait domain superfamily [Helianthus annuus]|nr:putative RNA recognition motif domain, nucleotide-binding alpha-beta plait domain superfamily [Helianthus annuus]
MSGERRRQDPEDWEQVVNRKGKRHTYKDEGTSKSITKFFISNLPPKCLSKDLKEVLGGFGRFEGSYIARKLDKWGKRFAFVSFRDVHDVKKMEEDMVDVWIGSYKLYVAIARFVDGETVTKPNNVYARKPSTVYQKASSQPNSRVDEEGMGYANAGGPNEPIVGEGRPFVDSLLNRNRMDVIRVEDGVEGFTQWNGKALVGKVADFKTLSSLKTMLCNRGWPTVEIKYVGGFTVVLVFNNSSDADSFFLESTGWSSWFSNLNRWDGRVIEEEERIVWLQVHGVPVQLALDLVFDSIGSRYGKIVQSTCLEEAGNNLSYALIAVLSKSCKRIVDRVDIAWRGKTFRVWVDEDIGEWILDCVADLDEDLASVVCEEDRLGDHDTRMWVMILRKERCEMKQLW